MPKNRNGVRLNIPIGLMVEYAKLGLNDAEIAQLVGCSKQNVNKQLQPYRDDVRQLDTFKTVRADVFAALGRQLLHSLTPSDIKGMSAAQRITCSAILYDKERLERGKSTANISYQQITNDIEALDAEIAEIEAQLSDDSQSGAVTGSEPDIPGGQN